MGQYNVGIVGCGGVSRIHLKALRKTAKCNIISACDIDKNTALKLANKFHIPRIYDDFASMLQKEKLDIVHVLTPPQVHASLAIEAMNAGCHVLVEKPMCMTVHEADEMINAARRNGVKLGVVHSYLFTPGIRKALELVKDGEVGDLLYVDTLVSIYSLRGWSSTDRYPAWYYTLQGALFGEILPHGLYVQLGFLGNVRKISAITRSSEETSELLPFSELQIMMDNERGSGGLFVSSRIKSHHAIVFIRIIGTKRIMFVNVPTATVYQMRFRGSDTLPMPREKSFLPKMMMNLEPAYHLISQTTLLGIKSLQGSVKLDMTHEILINQFIESLERQSDPPVTAEEGREVVRATNMLWENIL